MRPDDPNLEYLLVIADALGDLRNEVVFIGGCAAGLLLTDTIAQGIRATKDVDAIVEATTLAELYRLEARLPQLGFARDANGNLPLEAQRLGSAVRLYAHRSCHSGLLESVVPRGCADRSSSQVE